MRLSRTLVGCELFFGFQIAAAVWYCLIVCLIFVSLRYSGIFSLVRRFGRRPQTGLYEGRALAVDRSAFLTQQFTFHPRIWYLELREPVRR
jgi:hypothetical protein